MNAPAKTATDLLDDFKTALAKAEATVHVQANRDTAIVTVAALLVELQRVPLATALSVAEERVNDAILALHVRRHSSFTTEHIVEVMCL